MSPLGINESDLPKVPTLIDCHQCLERVFGTLTRSHQSEAQRTVACLGGRLSRHGPDPGSSPGHHASDGKPVRLDGNTHLSRSFVSSHYGKGHLLTSRSPSG